MPYDRAFAIENGRSGFDAAGAAIPAEIALLMLMRNERVATFRTRFDERRGDSACGAAACCRSRPPWPRRKAAPNWSYGWPTTSRTSCAAPENSVAAGHSFSRQGGKLLHLVNLASVRALEGKLGRVVDPLRFRPNIVVDGAPAWSEFDWAEGGVRLPGIRLGGESRTTRCAATNVDPQSGARDMEIPRALEALYGHADFGIYLRADNAGLDRRR
jgi:uncharacterized protein YcbX